MANPGQTGATTKYSTQNIWNLAFDETFGVPAVELLGYDPVANGLRRISVNASGNIIAEVGSTVLNGQKLVITTGVAVQISTTQVIKNGVIIQALAGNAGNVVVGSASVTTSTGFQLQPGQATSVAVSDLAALYVNGTAGDGICYISST